MVLKFSAEQFEVFAGPARDKWISETAQRLHQSYSAYFKSLEVEAASLEPLCQAVERWAAENRITGQRDVSQLCYVALTLGHMFWHDPRFTEYVRRSAENPEIPRGKAVEMLVANAQDWLASLWHNDTPKDFARRLDGYIRNNSEPSLQVLARILPGHWTVYDADTNEKLFAWLVQGLRPTALPAQRLAYVAFAFVYGTGWTRDPQFGLIERTVATAKTPTELADRLASIYMEMN